MATPGDVDEGAEIVIPEVAADVLVNGRVVLWVNKALKEEAKLEELVEITMGDVPEVVEIVVLVVAGDVTMLVVVEEDNTTEV